MADTSCQHIDEVLDQHTGDYICIHCGLVKDPFYQNIVLEKYDINLTQDRSDLVSNLIEKFNLADNHIEFIKAKLDHSSNNLKVIASEVYKNVNKNHTTLLLKNITNLTGLKSCEIKSENIHEVNLEDIIIKYMSLMNIPYKEAALFKRIIEPLENTGYQPLSIIGGLLYMYFAKRYKKKSMKSIASLLGINLISIQRFVKKNNVLFKQF